MNSLAKALYDNTAECADELAFRRGDILTVLEQSVAGTSGWWMCWLSGRQGLAPANRLQLLPQCRSPATATAAAAAATNPPSHTPEKRSPGNAKADDGVKNIYQIPSVPRNSGGHQTYELMNSIYKVPSAVSSPAALQLATEAPEGNKPPLFGMSAPKGEVYDVPSSMRRASLFTASTARSLLPRKHSLLPMSELEKRFESPESPGQSYVFLGPAAQPQDPNYDIPVPSAAEGQHKPNVGYSTLPNLRKPEWIYDVPVAPEKQSTYDTLPSKGAGRQLYDTLPPRAWSAQRLPKSLVYDIPKSSSLDPPSPPKVLPRLPVYDKPPNQRSPEESVYDVPPKEEPAPRGQSDPPGAHIPLECRGDSSSAHELTRVRLHRVSNFLACASLRNLKGSREMLEQDEDERDGASRPSAADSQRISTASNSSNSSCDSLTLSSSSLEPLREVTLGQDQACRRLVELRESVCKAVPRLMDFVSSRWRSREHLEKHLEEIKDASEGIASSVTCFLDFALDIRGNARHLTDANLQTRLCKQLSIVEDSGVILQQTVSSLSAAGWPLNALCQDPGQVQTPDQLERFVMVARTVPEDIKRLVSIVNANSKLLFRAPPREAEPPEASAAHTDARQSPQGAQHHADHAEPLDDDNDYVELQMKNENEKHEKEVQQRPQENPEAATKTPQHQGCESGGGTEEPRPSSRSEHCRLYFGALEKAIRGFVGSLRDGQPPEKFISQSKLVIMVGQRLVDSLCREAQRRTSSQNLLCKSNHLCALLKQLAVATKKAALHFPDKQSLCEAMEFAKELSKRAQHFRTSLDL